MTMSGAVFCHFSAKMSLFYQFLTENGTADPLFVLTENSLVAGVVGHPPIDLG